MGKLRVDRACHHFSIYRSEFFNSVTKSDDFSWTYKGAESWKMKTSEYSQNKHTPVFSNQRLFIINTFKYIKHTLRRQQINEFSPTEILRQYLIKYSKQILSSQLFFNQFSFYILIDQCVSNASFFLPAASPFHKLSIFCSLVCYRFQGI